MDTGVLAYLNPSNYAPDDRSYLWLYLLLVFLLAFLYASGKRGWDYMWTFRQARIERHTQQMKEIREAQVRRWAEEAANRPVVTAPPPAPTIDPALARRTDYMHENEGGNRPYRPSVRNRYKGVGKKGG
jgi:hypothetical protein